MIIDKGYHTLENRGNATEIEETGPIRAKRLDIAWLGNGFYFWDTESRWAHKWGTDYGEYMIFVADIRRDEFVYDLFGDKKHILDFLECADLVRQKTNKANRHGILVSEVIEYIKKNTNFNEEYNAIRCADYPNRPQEIAFRKGKPETLFIGGERVQYCLLNYKNIVKDSFKLFYPQNL